MYKYKFRVLELGNGGKELLIDFEEKGKDILSIFLEVEVSDFKDYVVEGIDKVLNGYSEYEELSGNVCIAKIHKDMTKIYNDLADDDMESCCEIETKQLKELIDIWCNELEKFRQQNL